MDLGIVVVSYNTRSLMADCLESAYRSLEAWGRDAHVWVVDNASSDGSAEMVRERFPQATLIASPDNLGFARANNLAMAEMAGPKSTSCIFPFRRCWSHQPMDTAKTTTPRSQ